MAEGTDGSELSGVLVAAAEIETAVARTDERVPFVEAYGSPETRPETSAAVEVEILLTIVEYAPVKLKNAVLVGKIKVDVALISTVALFVMLLCITGSKHPLYKLSHKPIRLLSPELLQASRTTAQSFLQVA